jgi:hypothetical protein
MPKFKVHGSFYGPNEEGANKEGYIEFWDVIEADTETEAIEMAKEDYGDYNAISCSGTVRNHADEIAWVARNPS